MVSGNWTKKSNNIFCFIEHMHWINYVTNMVCSARKPAIRLEWEAKINFGAVLSHNFSGSSNSIFVMSLSEISPQHVSPVRVSLAFSRVDLFRARIFEENVRYSHKNAYFKSKSSNFQSFEIGLNKNISVALIDTLWNKDNSAYRKQ